MNKVASLAIMAVVAGAAWRWRGIRAVVPAGAFLRRITR